MGLFVWGFLGYSVYSGWVVGGGGGVEVISLSPFRFWVDLEWRMVLVLGLRGRLASSVWWCLVLRMLRVAVWLR